MPNPITEHAVQDTPGLQDAIRRMVTHSAGVFAGAGGLELYYQWWLPHGESRAAVAIVHGWGEHSGRYAHVVRHFTARGYAIYGFDHRGHGHSPGQRGHVDSWSEYRQDVDAFLDIVQRQQPDRGVFLLGHSLGAVIALDHLLHPPGEVRGAILCSSALEPAGVASPSLVILSRLLSRVWPRFPVRLPLDASALSRDPEVVHLSRIDPLMHNRGSARWGTEVLDAIAWIRDHVSGLATPVLFLHGEADRLNLAEGTRRLFEAVTSPDKTLRVYPGMYHELHNDIDHEHILRDMAGWLDEHV